MPNIVRDFPGIMNTDFHPNRVGSTDFIDAFNISREDETVRGNTGNRKVPIAYAAGSTNMVIGSLADPLRNRIIFCVWSSVDYHSILSFSTITRAVTTIFQSRRDSDGVDILKFDRLHKVKDIEIIHRDSSEGDLLLLNDGYNPPYCINIDKILSVYGISVPYYAIRLAKQAPNAAPTVKYGSNPAVRTNAHKKKLYQARYRWVFKDGFKSTWSPISKMAIPDDAYTLVTEADPTKNNEYFIQVLAGGEDFQKIEIAVRESIGGAEIWSDFRLVDTLDRGDYNISFGGTYTYKFLNDGAYPDTDPKESDLVFSWIPHLVRSLALANGNAIVLGGPTEGYDQIPRSQINVQLTSSLVPTSNPGIVPGNPTISYRLTMEDNHHILYITIGGDVGTGFEYISKFKGNVFDEDDYYVDVQYLALAGDTINNVASALESLIQTQIGVRPGETSVTGATIRIRNVQVGRYPYSNVFVSATPTVLRTGGSPTFPWGGKYRFGLQYYDENGRTNGVISFVSDDDDANDFSVSTPEFAVAPSADNLPMIPIISASISHRPPTWATHFQWVRTQSLTASSYLHHITDRVQQDASYNYFSIENLNKFKDDNTGFIPGYTFVPGDRIRLITYLFPSGATFLYGTINYTIDAEILGVVDRVIATDNSDPENPVETTGKFIKFAKTFPGESYGNIILIQLYTPGNRGSDATQVFYEFGESYAISGTGANRFHRGSNQDQTASVPATFTFRDGDAYFKYRNFYTDSYSPANVYQQGIMDANYSDYWSSAVTSNGRPSVIDPSIKRQYHPGIIRFGLALQPDTNINQLNIFYPENFIETSREYGDIQKLKMRSTWLRVYFQLKVGKIPVYQRIIKDMSGNTFLTTADKLLSDIDYYTGDYGVGNTFESLAFSPFNDYWFSDIHSAFCRLGPNGIENLSEKKNLNVKSRQYAKYLRETGKKVYGVYDTKNEKYYACFEGSSTMPSLTIDFCEKKNGFNSRHGFYPEWIDSVNDLLICFIEGQIWTHDSTTVCNFFGIQQEMYIVGVANDGLLTKKDWSNITLLSDAAMDFPSITSNEKSGSLPNQTTILLETDFKYEESQFNASILRDINSPKALMGGEYIKGSVIVFTARKQNPTSAFYLNAVVVNYDESQLNKR